MDRFAPILLFNFHEAARVDLQVTVSYDDIIRR
jgi:hypothetical protein